MALARRAAAAAPPRQIVLPREPLLRRSWSATPLLEVLRRCPARLALVFGAGVGETMQFNITSVFALHYPTQHLQINPSVFLGAITIADLVSRVLIPAVACPTKLDAGPSLYLAASQHWLVG